MRIFRWLFSIKHRKIQEIDPQMDHFTPDERTLLFAEKLICKQSEKIQYPEKNETQLFGIFKYADPPPGKRST